MRKLNSKIPTGNPNQLLNESKWGAVRSFTATRKMILMK